MTILNNISKSLNVELDKFLLRFGNGMLASKQAFSKARYKLRHGAFIELNEALVEGYYASGDYQLYQDKYLLLATDGSDYQLPWEEGLVEYFGISDNKQGGQPVCMAKGVKIWDVLNHINVSAVLGRFDAGEINLFKAAWQPAFDLLRRSPISHPLLMGDMYYPSFWLMLWLPGKGIDFLFRCTPGFCREVVSFLQSGAEEAVLDIQLDDAWRKWKLRQRGMESFPEVLRVRAVRWPRPDGEISCLLTSVMSVDLDREAIAGLYPLRWGEEVSFGFDKNRSEVENFSAKRPEGILQDWHASILYANLTELLVEDAQEELDREQAAKQPPNKYSRQINRSAALGLVKDEIPKMLFGREAPADFYKRMIKLIVRHSEPVRPGRSFPRKRKHNLKFSMNLRRVT
jgi:hypothetical protein